MRCARSEFMTFSVGRTLPYRHKSYCRPFYRQLKDCFSLALVAIDRIRKLVRHPKSFVYNHDNYTVRPKLRTLLGQGFIQAPFFWGGGTSPNSGNSPPPMSEVRMMAFCSDFSDHSLSRATVSLPSLV